MDIERELELIQLKNKFMITLRVYLSNIGDTNFMHLTLDILKNKYKGIDDLNFLENIRQYIHPTNNIKNIVSNLNGIVYNHKNENVIIDLIRTMDTGINYEINSSIDFITSNVVEINDRTSVMVEPIAIIEQNTNILVDNKDN